MVPPFRRFRVRAEFDPAGLDMALTVQDEAGLVAAFADDAAGFEELEITAADAPRVVFVRCHHADPGAARIRGRHAGPHDGGRAPGER